MSVKRWMAGLLAIATVISMLPCMAFAADTPESAEETAVCRLTEGCTLVSGHEGDCKIELSEITEGSTDQEQMSEKETTQDQEAQEVPKTPAKTEEEISMEEESDLELKAETLMASSEKMEKNSAMTIGIEVETLAIGSEVQEKGITYEVTRLSLIHI